MKLWTSLFFVCSILAGLFPASVFAQDLLPRGVGLYQLGTRQYAPQTETYDQSGTKVPLGAKFDRDFNGQEMASGRAGPELKQLADELKKYDGASNGSDNLINSIDLGSLQGDVRADIQAHIFGMAFGLADSLTVFGGIPWIQASVDTELSFQGGNNAAEIKSRLGDLAYNELKAGLDQAQALNAALVIGQIEAAGYEPFEHWEHSGVGDAVMGLKTGFARRFARKHNYAFGFTTQLEVPTGYVEDPDILTDVSLGKGYYSLGLIVDQRLTLFRVLRLGADGAFHENFNAQQNKRLPVDNERLVAADRLTEVTLAPGDDINLATSVGLGFNWVTADYRLGQKRHFTDKYSGELDGNYEALGATSAKYQLYHEGILTLSSVKAFSRKSFPVPFILSFKSHTPIEAKNTADERYYELSISSFFSTPMARGETKTAKKKKRRKNQRSKYAKTAY